MRQHAPSLLNLILIGSLACGLAGCNGKSPALDRVPAADTLPSLDRPSPDRPSPDAASDLRAPDLSPYPDTRPPDLVPPDAIHVDDLQDGQTGSGTAADPYRDLQVAIDKAPAGATLLIHAGQYQATPAPYADPGCGNCDDAEFAKGAKATRGFLVGGKGLHLIGEGMTQTVLVTGAGYGLLFDEAGSSSVRLLKVTGGKRDADGRATDAGIVVRKTTLLVSQVAVVGNDDLYAGPEPDPVVGVGGVFGREGSDITLLDSIIEDNSWDGVALYRGIPGQPGTGAKARIERCRIGCTSKCVSPRGRGVGIGITWDAQVTAVGNHVHHYWKGIGSFGTSQVEVRNNLVIDQVGWGIIASGQSTMHARNNVVIRAGTTGMAAWNSGAKGSFMNNIVTGCGTASDEWVGKKTGVWLNATGFTFAYNLVFGNQVQQVCTGGVPGGAACTPVPFEGLQGNLSKDPLFAGPSDFHLKPGSPAIDAGDPSLKDPDGSRSDMGLFGGPDAPAKLP